MDAGPLRIGVNVDIQRTDGKCLYKLCIDRRYDSQHHTGEVWYNNIT